MEGELRDQVERLLLRMNLVTREEFEVVAALAQTARAEQEVLTERLAVLEAQLAAQKAAPARKSASSSPAVPKTARRRRGET
jgi:BMFP domain-containing protein YqiC